MEFIREVAKSVEYLNLLNWTEVSTIELDSEFIEQYADKLNWDMLSKYQKFNLDMINKYESKINYGYLVENERLSLDVLEAKLDKMDWKIIQSKQNLSEDFIVKNLDKLEIKVILKHQKLSSSLLIDILEQNPIKSYFDLALTYQKIDEEFINKYMQSDLVDFNILITEQKLSENIIDKLIDYESPDGKIIQNILRYQELSENYLIKHWDTLKSYDLLILRCQKLSKEFMEDKYKSQLTISDYAYAYVQYQTFYPELINLETLDNEYYTALFIKSLGEPIDIVFDETRIDWDSVNHEEYTDQALINLVQKYSARLNLQSLCTMNRFPESVLQNITDINIWWFCLGTYKYPKEFKQANIKYLNLWEQDESVKSEINSTTLRMFVRANDWNHLLRDISLPEWFIEFVSVSSDRIDMFWWKVSRYQKLSEEFMRKYMDKLDMSILLGYQTFSEEYLTELAPFFNEDCWDKVERFQKTTSNFRNKFT